MASTSGDYNARDDIRPQWPRAGSLTGQRFVAVWECAFCRENTIVTPYNGRDIETFPPEPWSRITIEQIPNGTRSLIACPDCVADKFPSLVIPPCHVASPGAPADGS